MKKTILVLGAGIMQVPIIQQCMSLGYTTIVLDADNDAPGMQLGDVSYAVSTLDKEEALKIAKHHQVSGIVTTSDLPVNTVAFVCAHLNLNGMSIECAEICTNKFLQRKLSAKNGLNVPEFKSMSFDNKCIVDDLSYPVIIKPHSSSASRGITIVRKAEDFEAGVLRAQAVCKGNHYLVEEFILGEEYSVEGLVQDNNLRVVAITEKFVKNKGDYNFPVEVGHITPTNFDPQLRNEIEDFIQKVIWTFSINNCAFHLEFKVSDNKLFLIECACRLGGDFITSDLVPLATGVNMMEAIIDIALGNPIQITPSRDKYAGIAFLHTENYHHLKYFIENDGKNEIEQYVLEEFRDVALESSLNRLGYIILVDTNRENLKKKLYVTQR